MVGMPPRAAVLITEHGRRVRSVAFEQFVIGHLDKDVEITRRPAAHAHFAFASEDAGAGFDARGC